jgi:PAS domain S-box-containing protein
MTAAPLESDDARRLRALANLIDLEHDAIFARDAADLVTFWSPGAEALYGWRAADALGRNAHELLATKLPEPFAAIAAKLGAEGRWEGEVTRAHRSGAIAIVSVRWAVRRDGAGNIVEILESGRDVTARAREREALEKSEFRYRNMFEAMAVSFWDLDFTGVGNLLRKWKASGVTDLRRYLTDNPALIREAMAATMALDANEQSVRLFGGKSREELLGPSDRFWPEESNWVYLESVIAAVGRKSHYEAECRMRKLNGQLFDALFTVAFPTGAVGRGSILVGIVDMSERNRARDALAHVQAELAHAARVGTLGELTASIAHEVNQPLAAIVTSGEAGLRWLDRAEPDLGEARSALGRMVADGKRAAAIIGRIRAMATKRAIERVRLKPNELVAEAAALLAREISAHAATLRVELAPEAAEIDGDRVQLQQVLVNLLVNALQAMAQSDARELVVRTLCGNGVVAFEIEDSGPGVAPEAATGLFKAFNTTKPNGMGLGLSLCRSIVEAHGGAIALAPKAGPGARFRFTLPAA